MSTQILPPGLLALAVVMISVSAFGAADPLSEWHKRNPLGAGGTMSDVVYANGLFVGSTLDNSIVTSADGVSWTSHVLPRGEFGNGLLGVAFGIESFVAVGYSGAVFVSTNAADWTRRTVGGLGGGLYGVTYGGGIFVAVGGEEGGSIFTSTNGQNWTRRTSGFSSGLLFSVTYGNGLFVATGAEFSNMGLEGVVLTSPDGTIRFVIEAHADRELEIEFSADLRQWTTLRRMSNPAGLLELEDTDAVGVDQRFYRAKLLAP